MPPFLPLPQSSNAGVTERMHQTDSTKIGDVHCFKHISLRQDGAETRQSDQWNVTLHSARHAKRLLPLNPILQRRDAKIKMPSGLCSSLHYIEPAMPHEAEETKINAMIVAVFTISVSKSCRVKRSARAFNTASILGSDCPSLIRSIFTFYHPRANESC